ncbi:MAG: hypothetical protein WC435_00535 [Candidatus Paceibacterota bacterium]
MKLKNSFGLLAIFMAMFFAIKEMSPVLPVLAADNFEREAADFTRQPGKKRVVIYPVIPIVEEGNFRELELTLQDPFIYLREMFSLYSNTLSDLVSAPEGQMGGGDMPFTAEINNFSEKNIPGIIDALSRIFLTLCEYSEQRVEKVKAGAAESFSSMIKSGFDDCFRRYGIQNGARRASFMDKSSMSEEALFYGFTVALEEEKKAAPIKISWEIWKEILQTVDYVMFGSYTVLQSALESESEIRLRLDLTAVNIRTGERRQFSSEGSINEVAILLGEAVFDAFQRNIYSEWISPLSQIEWIQTQPVNLRLTSSEAREYCESQGGRLPTARQMLQAFPGGRYLNGGIELKPNEYYLVRDTTLTGDSLYFVYEISNRSGSEGPIRTAPGINFRSLFWCMRDFNYREPMEDLEEGLRNKARMLLREKSEATEKKTNLVLEIIYFLQNKIGDMTAFPEYEDRFDFDSVKEAIEILREEEKSKNVFKNN